MTKKCIDIKTALDWQRSNAELIQKLIDNQQNWLDENHCQFWKDWNEFVFRLSTANDFGLAVWSIILDEPVYGFTGAAPEDYPSFGFSEDDENFYDGSFASDTGFTYPFQTEEKRIILLLKAFKVLSMGGTIDQINKAMANIFGDGKIVVFDRLDMSFVYLLNDNSLIDFAREIRARDLFPRPLGIDASIIRVLGAKTFGFHDDAENFFDGNFYDGEL